MKRRPATVGITVGDMNATIEHLTRKGGSSVDKALARFVATNVTDAIERWMVAEAEGDAHPDDVRLALIRAFAALTATLAGLTGAEARDAPDIIADCADYYARCLETMLPWTIGEPKPPVRKRKAKAVG